MRLAMGLLFVIVAFFFANAASAAPCGPRTTESNDQVVYATDCTTGSSTGGIQEAIDACGSGWTTTGCVVMMPRGQVVLSSTITIGGLTGATAKAGVTLRGHGNGLVTYNPRIPDAGTTLVWDGDGGTVLAVQGIGHRLEDFMIWGDDGGDGTNVADTLLEIRADGGSNTSSIIVENVHLRGSRDASTKPLGLFINGINQSDQLDRIEIRNTAITWVSTCVRQNSNQALLNVLQVVNCASYTEYGVDVLAGSLTVLESVFSSSRDSGAIAAIRYHSAAGFHDPIYQNVERSHFEIGSGSGIIATSADGKRQKRAMRISGNNFVMQYADPSPDDPSADNDFINIQERGSVAIIGNSFEWTTGNPPISGVGGDIVVSSSLESQVFAAANYTRNLVNLDWEIGGSASLVCNDADALGVFDDVDCDSVRDPGEAYLNGASGSNNHGAVRWGVSDTASWDSGDEVCADSGLACVSTFSVGGGNQTQTCSHTYGSADLFLALCK